ncbi:MAG TPA: phosphoglycolate phosphatase [Alphaproteobacteria bacterium]|nr:phosphoglycolate phosphatase [Alphaproteobacteria bacterium]
MPRKRRAIVFDLDGTLIDSVPDIHRTLNRVLDEAGRHPVGIEAVKLMVGDGARVLVEKGFAATGPALDAASLDRAYGRFLACYEGPETAGLTRPYPGVRATLEWLLDRGFRLGICTNKPKTATADVLDRLDLARFFDAVVTPEQVSAHKPHPAHLLATLAVLRAEPAEAVMVGDNANDVAVAHGAGVPVIAVTYGYPRMAPADLGADLLIDEMAALPAALDRLA